MINLAICYIKGEGVEKDMSKTIELYQRAVDLNNSNAIRLTSNISEVSSPLLSPDGKWIAFVGTEDGVDIIQIEPIP